MEAKLAIIQDLLGAPCVPCGAISPTRYNLPMRFTAALSVLVFCTAAVAQSTAKLASQPELKSTTVPITLDHNRVVVDVNVLLHDGTTQRVHAWVDNGTSDLWISKSLAALLRLTIVCNGQECGAVSTKGAAPIQIMIGGLKVALPLTAGIKFPGFALPAAASTVAPGISAQIRIPSTVLRNYDILIDFPDDQLTIAQPGVLKFNGVETKVIVNPESGLIQVPSKIDEKRYNLALDLGSSISFLADELFDKLTAVHPDWAQMTGAVGPANLWGLPGEPNWKLMRLGRLQYGPLYLTSVPFVRFSAPALATFEKRAGVPSAGLLGSEALLNYRVGLDYAHATVYFDIGRLSNVPDFDVVGVILRPEDDGRFTILGVADYEGKPSVPEGADGIQAGDHLVAVDGIPILDSSMGAVWSMLGGSLGKERVLSLERGGKRFTVAAKVQHFLGDVPGEYQTKEKSGKRN
ncbi:MAG: hypothetical protein WAM69_02125 [Candidatus Sulfotelmatobacter sp.]